MKHIAIALHLHNVRAPAILVSLEHWLCESPGPVGLCFLWTWGLSLLLKVKAMGINVDSMEDISWRLVLLVMP